MKTFFAIVLLFISPFVCTAGDSINFVINGQVMAQNTMIPVPNPEITLILNHNRTFFTVGGKNGKYELKGTIAKSEEANFTFKINATNHYPSKWETGLEAKKDIEKTQNLSMIPKMECWDSKMPGKIHFDKDEVTLNPDIKAHLKKLFSALVKSQSHILDSFVIELTAYRDYPEEETISSKRADYIYDLLISCGFKDKNIRKIDGGKKNLYYCQYCEGCHYYFLKGQGVDLKPQFFESVDPKESDYYHSLRRVVTLFWIKE